MVKVSKLTFKVSRGHSAHMHRGVSQSIVRHFILRNLGMGMVCHEAMQTKVRVGSNDPRNVSLIIFDAGKIS